jgi:hypothetical protein
MLSFLQDFLKAPWFATRAIVTLGLGIAVNTTIFSVVNGFLLRPLPVAHPEQLVVLSLQQGGDHALQNFSYQTMPIFGSNPVRRLRNWPATESR